MNHLWPSERAVILRTMRNRCLIRDSNGEEHIYVRRSGVANKVIQHRPAPRRSLKTTNVNKTRNHAHDLNIDKMQQQICEMIPAHVNLIQLNAHDVETIKNYLKRDSMIRKIQLNKLPRE